MSERKDKIFLDSIHDSIFSETRLHPRRLSPDLTSFFTFFFLFSTTRHRRGGEQQAVARGQTADWKYLRMRREHHLSCAKQKVRVSCNPRLDPTANRLTSPAHLRELQWLLSVHNERHKAGL